MQIEEKGFFSMISCDLIRLRYNIGVDFPTLFRCRILPTLYNLHLTVLHSVSGDVRMTKQQKFSWRILNLYYILLAILTLNNFG